MQFQEGECSNIANIAREPDNEMRPDRPVPSGCGQNARLRRREACPYSRYGLRPAPGIHRVLAATHHASVIEIGSKQSFSVRSVSSARNSSLPLTACALLNLTRAAALR